MNSIYLDYSPNHSSSGWSFAGGGVSGENYGTISNVEVSNLWLSASRQQSAIGGIVGMNKGYVTNCIVRDSNNNIWPLPTTTGIIANGDAGGIAGHHLGGEIKNCLVNNVLINGYHVSTSRSIGGIVGYMSNASLVGCRISNSIIQNTGGNESLPSAYPCMGKIVGHFDGNSVLRLGGVSVSNLVVNVSLLPGKLTTSSQLGNFGKAQRVWGSITLPEQ